MRRLTWLSLPLIVICVVGCGSSKSSSSSASAPPSSSSTSTAAPSSGPAKALTVDEKEYSLTPSKPTVAGGSVRVTARNTGAGVHALEIENAGQGGKDLRSADIQPGSGATLFANLKPGKTYQWYCPIDGHKRLGMKGTITVTSSGGAKVTPPPAKSTSTGSTSSSGGYGY